MSSDEAEQARIASTTNPDVPLSQNQIVDRMAKMCSSMLKYYIMMRIVMMVLSMIGTKSNDVHNPNSNVHETNLALTNIISPDDKL
ncbi:MAG: hypothetical protein MHPSP_001309, partial [Paramarteilia canceri]